MAETTTAINACDAVIKLDDQTGSLQDISGSSNSVDMEFTIDTAEYSTFEGVSKRRLQCKKDASFTLRAVYSTTDDEALHILKNWYFDFGGTARTFQVHLPDASIGNDRYYGEVVLESLSIPTDGTEAGPIIVEASLLPDGEWNVETIGS